MNSFAFCKAPRRETTNCWPEASLGAGRGGTSLGLSGAHGPAYVGLAATTQVPMGGKYPYCHQMMPKPIPGPTERFQKK